MKAYEFVVCFNGPELTDETLRQFFESGCNDALTGEVSGQKEANFTRSGDSFADAVIPALESLSGVSGVSGVIVTEIVSEDHPEQAERFNRALLVTH